MSVYKYNSIRYNGGVDISNTLNLRRDIPEENPSSSEQPKANPSDAQKNAAANPVPEEPKVTAEEILAKREAELKLAANELEKRKKELAALKEQYIEQGKQVIIEAKRRAEGIVNNANSQADEIVREAEGKRDDVFIKARAEGFEQGKKDGAALVQTESMNILDEARGFSERINTGKAELFAKYEQEIYETVMEIANKVTMNSMSVKDGTAAKKLIKAAAKEFRNSQLIRISLDKNNAFVELAGDYEYLKELCGGMAHVEVELLENAEPGTVIVDNGEEITDAGIQTQLRMIRELGDGEFKGEAPKKRSARRRKGAAEQAVEQNENLDENDENNG